MAKQWRSGQYMLRTVLKRSSVGEPIELDNPARFHRFIVETAGIDKDPFESVGIVVLDARFQVLGWEVIAKGNYNTCSVLPAQALLPIILAGGSAGILFHNHPSGNPEPSDQDIAMTRRMVQAFDSIGIQFLDHIVIGDGRFVSMEARGMIPNPKRY